MIPADISGTWQQLVELMSTNAHLIPPVVFLLGFAESIVVISLLVPSTVLFLGIGGLYAAAGGEFVTVWLAGATGAFLGDILSYGVGRWLGFDLLRLWPFNRRVHWMAAAKTYEQKWGMLSVIGSKFLGMLRPLVPVVAGILAMPAPRFLAASAISSLLWAGVFLSPGWGIALIGDWWRD